MSGPVDPRPDGYLTHDDSVVVAADPATVFAIVSDVTRVGEWSPVCRACEWEDGDAPAPGEPPRVGARFTGHNAKRTDEGERAWDTVSTVTAAEPGRRFAWEVGDGFVAWSFELEAHPIEGDADGATTGTLLRETWELRPAGVAIFRQRYGERADAEIADRRGDALAGIPATLDAVRRIAEG